jgi:hypothetical protein
MTQPHVGLLKLRRLWLGELSGAEADEARSHAEGCAECRARLEAFDDEQREFQQAVPFERFEAGVQRAQRRERTAPRRQWVAPVMAMAASILVVLAIQPSMSGRNRTKGGADVVVTIAGPNDGPQRIAPAGVPEMLAPGERVRIGYEAGPWRYVLVLSVDEAGKVTPLYPEAGASLPTEGGPGPHYLPDSLIFDGKGAERVIAVMSEQALQVPEAIQATERAFQQAGGDVRQLPKLALPGRTEQLDRILLKP